MDEAIAHIAALLQKFDPSQPRDDTGRWSDGGGSSGGGSGGDGGGGGGGTPAGATANMGRSDGTGFKSKADQERAAKWVGEADAQLGEMKKQYPGLKNLKVDHVHVYNSDSIPSDAHAKGVGQGTIGLYFKGRVNIALSSSAQNESEGITLGRFRSTSGTKGTFAHEVAHHVERTVLTKVAQKEWLGVWRQWGRGTFEKVSRYATTDYSEAFAESFAAYTSKGYGGQLPQPVHAFMNKHIAKKGK